MDNAFGTCETSKTKVTSSRPAAWPLGRIQELGRLLVVYPSCRRESKEPCRLNASVRRCKMGDHMKIKCSNGSLVTILVSNTRGFVAST